MVSCHNAANCWLTTDNKASILSPPVLAPRVWRPQLVKYTDFLSRTSLMRRWLQGTTAASVESLRMSTAAACMAAEGLQRSSIVIDAHSVCKETPSFWITLIFFYFNYINQQALFRNVITFTCAFSCYCKSMNLGPMQNPECHVAKQAIASLCLWAFQYPEIMAE